MLYFCIPLRARAASKNWDNVISDFNHTLHSCYAQTCPEFRIIVCCHDIPPLFHAYDERVVFLTTSVPIPKTIDEMLRDKRWKLFMAGAYVRAQGGGYTMNVDADDLIANCVAQHCHDHPNEYGFVSKTGYIWHRGKKTLKLVSRLDKYCGSCTVLKSPPESLLRELPDAITGIQDISGGPMLCSHAKIVSEMEAQGTPLASFPFISTIYVLGTGENHSVMVKKRKAQQMPPVRTTAKKKSRARRLLMLFLNPKEFWKRLRKKHRKFITNHVRISKKIRRTFSIDF